MNWWTQNAKTVAHECGWWKLNWIYCGVHFSWIYDDQLIQLSQLTMDLSSCFQKFLFCGKKKKKKNSWRTSLLLAWVCKHLPRHGKIGQNFLTQPEKYPTRTRFFFTWSKNGLTFDPTRVFLRFNSTWPELEPFFKTFFFW